jgi:hypothetical protein
MKIQGVKCGEREREEEGFSKDNETNIVKRLAPPSTLFL